MAVSFTRTDDVQRHVLTKLLWCRVESSFNFGHKENVIAGQTWSRLLLLPPPLLHLPLVVTSSP